MRARESSGSGHPSAALGVGDTAVPRGVRDDDARASRYVARRVRSGLRNRQVLTASDGRRQHRRLGPGCREADHDPAARPDEPSGGMEERVAPTRWRGVAPWSGQTRAPEPRHEVARHAHRREPRRVGGEVRRRQMGQARRLEVADDWLAAASPPVQRFEKRDIRVREVGQAELVAMPVDVGEGQLGLRVRDLAPDQQPAPGRPPPQVHIRRYLRDFPHVAFRQAVGCDRRHPPEVPASDHRGRHVLREGEPHDEADGLGRGVIQKVVGAAGTVRPDDDLPLVRIHGEWGKGRSRRVCKTCQQAKCAPVENKC